MSLEIKFDTVREEGMTKEDKQVLEELREGDFNNYGLQEDYVDYLDTEELDAKSVTIENIDGVEYVRVKVGNITVRTQRGQSDDVELPSGRTVNIYIVAG